MESRATWALVVATYKRHEILRRCLKATLEQTRLPTEIVVVDSSPNAAEAKPAFEQEFGGATGIRFVYDVSSFPSSTAQRNRGAQLASADVVFMIDDDSIMYPDCAAEIMAVYDRDPEGQIAGVSAIHVPVPPDAAVGASSSEPEASAPAVKEFWLRRAMRDMLQMDTTRFVPYDREFPTKPIPDSVPGVTIGRIQVMAGYAMTFRRAVVLQQPFDEVLQRYAAGEDQDVSYRASRQGAIVNAVNARLCHLLASSGRLPPFVVSVLANLNPVVLHRKFSTDTVLSERRLRAVLRRRFAAALMKDAAAKDWKFSSARGVGYAMLKFRSIWRQSPEQLSVSYPQFQTGLLQRHGKAPRR